MTIRSNANVTFLHRLQQLVPLPDFVKGAAAGTLDGDDTLPPAGFADPGRRDYACHTAAATWLSAARLQETGAALAPSRRQFLQNRLKEAATYHGILGPVQELWRQLEQVQQQASASLPDSDFALVTKQADGSTQRRYRLASAADLQQATTYLRQYGREFTYADRKTMAGKVLAKTAQYGALPAADVDFLERLAGQGTCATATVIDQLQTRIQQLQNRPGEAYTVSVKLAALVQQCRMQPRAARRPSFLQKVAEILDTTDQAFQLKLPPIEEALFLLNHTKLAALKQEQVETATGRIYALDELQRLPLPQIQAVLGDDVAAAVSTNGQVDRWKLAEELPALPKPESALLDRLAAACGIRPVASSAPRPRLLSATGG